MALDLSPTDELAMVPRDLWRSVEPSLDICVNFCDLSLAILKRSRDLEEMSGTQEPEFCEASMMFYVFFLMPKIHTLSLCLLAVRFGLGQQRSLSCNRCSVNLSEMPGRGPYILVPFLGSNQASNLSIPCFPVFFLSIVIHNINSQ